MQLHETPLFFQLCSPIQCFRLEVVFMTFLFESHCLCFTGIAYSLLVEKPEQEKVSKRFAVYVCVLNCVLEQCTEM